MKEGWSRGRGVGGMILHKLGKSISRLKERDRINLFIDLFKPKTARILQMEDILR